MKLRAGQWSITGCSHTHCGEYRVPHSPNCMFLKGGRIALQAHALLTQNNRFIWCSVIQRYYVKEKGDHWEIYITGAADYWSGLVSCKWLFYISGTCFLTVLCFSDLITKWLMVLSGRSVDGGRWQPVRLHLARPRRHLCESHSADLAHPLLTEGGESKARFHGDAPTALCRPNSSERRRGS